MKITNRYIFLLPLLVLSLLAGCGQEAKRPGKASLEGLTLSDLQPEGQPERQLESAVLVLAYQVPLEKAGQIPAQLKSLSSGAIEFGDRDGFKANALWAGLGDAAQAAEVRRQLAELGEPVGQMSYLLFDESPEALAGYPVAHGQSLSFYRADGSAVLREVPAGVISLLFRRRENAADPASIRLSLVPVFESKLSQQLKRMGRPASDDGFAVQEASLQATMQEGDFLVLAVTEDQRATNSLHWFFQSPAVREDHVLLYILFYASAGGVDEAN